jgi:hypothetical protein
MCASLRVPSVRQTVFRPPGVKNLSDSAVHDTAERQERERNYEFVIDRRSSCTRKVIR